MKVVILTEGGRGRGLGHVTRCLSLWQALSDHDVQASFLVNGDSSVESALKGVEFGILDWLATPAAALDSIDGRTVVVLDSYHAGAGFYRRVSEQAGLLVSLDDYCRLSYPAGLVVNGALFAQALPYPSAQGLLYVLGSSYAPLRRAFWDAQPQPLRPSIENVLLTFGNEDVENVTPTVLRALRERHPEWRKTVVIGSGFHNTGQISALDGDDVELVENPGASGMRDAMQEADLAVSAAGQTLYELARLGLPTIGVQVVDNQEHHASSWQEAGFIRSPGAFDSPDFVQQLLRVTDEMTPLAARIESSEAGRMRVKGSGSRRIVGRILQAAREKDL